MQAGDGRSSFWARVTDTGLTSPGRFVLHRLPQSPPPLNFSWPGMHPLPVTSPRRASQTSQGRRPMPFTRSRQGRVRRRHAVFFEGSETDERARLQLQQGGERESPASISPPSPTTSSPGTSVASAVASDAEVSDPDSPEPAPAHAAIRLFCQLRPHEAPRLVEVYFFDNNDEADHSGDDDDHESPVPTVRLVVPASPPNNPRKRRREEHNERDEENMDEDEDEDEEEGQRSRKRGRTLPIASERFGTGAVGVRLLRRQSRDHGQEEQHECIGVPVDGYMMDLGLVKLFPETPTKDEAEDEDVTMADDGNQDPKSFFVVIVTVSIAIVLVVGVGLALILLIKHYPSFHLGSRQTSIIPFQPVNWAHEAAMIEAELTTISRVMLFGETCMEELRWHGAPGLRPDSGFSHLGRPFKASLYVPPQCFSDSPLRPSYKPWETTSSGTFVPESWFLDDVRRIMSSLKTDLAYLADHGPFSFRFTKGDSTQFRWSTDRYNFLPPHDSLPTLDPYADDYLSPASTVHGLPSYEPGHAHPKPTARPAEPYEINNLDPPLSQLIRDWDLAWTELEIWHEKTHQRLATYYVQISEERAAWQLLGMYQSEVKQQMENGPDWVSGDTIVKHPISAQPSLGTENRGARTVTTFGDRAPKESAPPLSCETWAGEQTNNKTMLRVLDYLNTTIKLPLNGEDDEGSSGPPTYNHLATYRDTLTSIHELLQDFYNRAVQVVRQLPLNEDSDGNEWGKATDRVRSIHDVAVFLDQIVMKRLADMKTRADRGVLFLQRAQKRQAALREDFERTTP
ncbi:hypothetical protein G7046_g4005 [Stylonectria norvegica]|nr:hypothetical protein G7046_g4005 [Stylonectria norvegica]